MLISNVHKSIIVMNSLDTRFSKNVFEAVQKTRSTCFIGSKTTRLRLVVLNPIKHSCSFFKHYINECRLLIILMTLNLWFTCTTLYQLMMSICDWTEVPRQKQGSAVAVPAFKPPKIADSSNTNQWPSVSKFYLNIMWEGTNPGLGRTIFNAFIGTVLKSNPTKRHVQ